MLLSICVLTYNRAHLLQELVQSIFESGVLDNESIELVILNNGSTDKTVTYLESLPKQSNIRIHHRDFNLRGSASYQELFHFAQGEWIISPGDDDVFLPKNFLEASRFLKQVNESIKLVPYAAQTINATGGNTPVRFQPKNEVKRVKLLAELMSKSLYWFPATFFRRSLVIKNDAPRTITVFDWWIWIQGILHGDVIPQSTELIKYRIHDGQEQLTFNDQLWNLDYAQAFIEIINSQQFRQWVNVYDLEEINIFLKEIGNANTFENSVNSQLVWLNLGKVLLEANSQLEVEIVAFLVEMGIDVRFITQYFQIELKTHYLKMALRKLGKLELEIESLGSNESYETELNKLLYEARVREKEKTLTPFENRLIGNYRRVRYSHIVRKLLRK